MGKTADLWAGSGNQEAGPEFCLPLGTDLQQNRILEHMKSVKQGWILVGQMILLLEEIRVLGQRGPIGRECKFDLEKGCIAYNSASVSVY